MPYSKSALPERVSVKEFCIKPWKESFRLLRSNKAFLQFQLGFFIAGSGLMFAKPSIPKFLGSLSLSILEIFSLFTLLEGLGFVSSSTIWAKYLQRVGLHKSASAIAIFFSLQPLLFLIGDPATIYAAYFIYGIAQAGSTLVWNLSGSLLCGKESSSQYTAVNILAIGVRGCFVPLAGAFCTELFSSNASFFVSFCCMLTGAYYLWKCSLSLSPLPASSGYDHRIARAASSLANLRSLLASSDTESVSILSERSCVCSVGLR